MEELIWGGYFPGYLSPKAALELPCQEGWMGPAQACGGSSGIPGVDPTHPVCFGSASRPFKWIPAGG